MKVFDRYSNLEPITIRGEYERVVAVIPEGTPGCIYRLPTQKYPDPCFEVVYEGQWYAARVKKCILKAQRGNAQVQQLMVLCPAITRCQDDTKHNIRTEVTAVGGALNHFSLQVYPLRFLPPDDMKQALGAIRQDTTFQDRLAELYGKKAEKWARITYEVSWGHYEYLLRTLERFLATGTLNRQLCRFLLSHQEPVMREKTTPCTETAIAMTHRVAQEQAATLVAQENAQAHPYPFLYAAYIMAEQIQYELLQAWYTYKDISYTEQERIAKEALAEAGYPQAVI
jgi:hypothetical protein